MRRVGIAAGSPLAAEAAAHVADLGGNAVDAAVAATMTAMCTDPGVMAVGAGAFVAISVPGVDPVVIDGYMEMPGRSVDPSRLGSGDSVYSDWAGGLRTTIGPGSIATPGAVAALGLASERYGAIPWRRTLEPVIEAVDGGFEVSELAADYLAYWHDSIFGWHPESRATLHHEDGSAVVAGDIVELPDLVGTLHLLADDGAEAMYQGELADLVAEAVQEGGGLLTREDLAEYRAVVRRPLELEMDDWTLFSNPPPAVGGACTLAITALAGTDAFLAWDKEGVTHVAEVMAAVLGYRERILETAEGDRSGEVEELMGLVASMDLPAIRSSSSTSHSSAVDTNGVACAITASSGYGSGMVIPGTGIWMNNSLGELELNPRGYHALEPGTRLLSNMAPTVGRAGNRSVLACGSPGASRISSAIALVLLNHIHLGMSLHESVEHPRLHVGGLDGVDSVVLEPGLPRIELTGLPTFRYPDLSSYFGGVQVALWDPVAGLFEVADPRRSGAVAQGGVAEPDIDRGSRRSE